MPFLLSRRSVLMVRARKYSTLINTTTRMAAMTLDGFRQSPDQHHQMAFEKVMGRMNFPRHPAHRYYLLT